ncbi:hypothetical protein [Vibrio parahaemolyticus]|uniref:hypothetical protein n=1 Tax=Vibrio parahaemolyticus TaxID=670 RepID=UPI00226A7E82|nr:hypothetical protein [Vibrio parahaemolyticus]MCX8796176.1 hypothetical protein [Vibrio parahaemolyticus]
MKFSGEYKIALPVCVKGLDKDKFAEILDRTSEIVDTMVRVRHPIMKDHITLSNVVREESTFEIIDEINEGGSEDGYHVRLNAIIPVEIKDVKCNGDKTADILAKVLEVVNMNVTCNDYVYRDLIDIEEANGIQEIITYDVIHDEPEKSVSGLER